VSKVARGRHRSRQEEALLYWYMQAGRTAARTCGREGDTSGHATLEAGGWCVDRRWSDVQTGSIMAAWCGCCCCSRCAAHHVADVVASVVATGCGAG
jgi:hypothetical protein